MKKTHKMLLDKYRTLVEAETIVEVMLDKIIYNDYDGIENCIGRLVDLDILTEEEANEITKDLSNI